MYPVLRTPVTGNHTPNHVDTGYRWLIHVLTLLVLSSCTCLILGHWSNFAVISLLAKLVFQLEICNLSLLWYKKVVVDQIVKVCSGHVLIGSGCMYVLFLWSPTLVNFQFWMCRERLSDSQIIVHIGDRKVSVVFCFNILQCMQPLNIMIFVATYDGNPL